MCNEKKILHYKEILCDQFSHNCDACPLSRVFWESADYEKHVAYNKHHRIKRYYRGITVCEMLNNAKYYRRRDHHWMLKLLKYYLNILVR